MNRRSVLGLIGALGAGAGGTLLVQNGGDIDDTISQVQNAGGSTDSNESDPAAEETPSGPANKDFGMFSNGFEAAEWTSEQTLALEISDDHDMDGIGFRYHAKSTIEDDIIVKTAPTYGGTVEFDVLGAIAELDSRPPAGEYQFIGYKGEFGDFLRLAEETVGSVSLQVEPDLALVDASTNSEGRLSVQVENTGNAPAVLIAADVNDSRAEFGSVLPVGRTTVSSTNAPFAKDDCVQRPTELGVSLVTGPKVEATGEFGGVETTKECSIALG